MAKAEFIARDNEQIFAERVSADCWNMPQVMGNRQISGKVYFTDQRVAFLASGLIGTKSVSWEIEMQNIASVETCTTPPFFPFGIDEKRRPLQAGHHETREVCGLASTAYLLTV